ncbi:heterokaryon incompatibility protein-domain-containing protein [Xylariaceae sp. FL1651]|nr:heterokaryon incompatibility protein-domain-containing protein [Xylariaceae sp. FL1651]
MDQPSGSKSLLRRLTGKGATKDPNQEQKFRTRPITAVLSNLPSVSSGPRPVFSRSRVKRHSQARAGTFQVNASTSNAELPKSDGATSGTSLAAGSCPKSGFKTFQYSQLRSSEIRLVQLLPSDTGTGIYCTISHTTFDRAPEYIALSYAWGDIDNMMNIQMAGLPLKVTASLYCALQAVQEKSETVTLWADALCINQGDKMELSRQVQFMAQIYGQAASVAVWLGPETARSDLAITLLKTLLDAWAKDQDTMSNSAVADLIASDEWRPNFAALVDLFQRDYWHRLWVVQEILNAKDVLVYCGNSCLPWLYYYNASLALYQCRPHLERAFPVGITRIMGESSPRQRYSFADILTSQGPAGLEILKLPRMNDVTSFLQVIRICRTKLASEPRDKVFGILGILSDSIQKNFPLNYYASVRKIYTDVVKFVLDNTGRLDILCEAIYFPLHTSSTRAKLPSWAPDWSHIPQVAALGFSYDFLASGHTKAEYTFMDPPLNNRLRISAVRLDGVAERAVGVGTFCRLDDSLMAFLHWRAKYLHRAKPPWQDHVAFCRTVALGQVNDWQSPAEWTKVCYHIFASLIRERLPELEIGEMLHEYATLKVRSDGKQIDADDYRGIWTEHCANKMMGRCFFMTTNGLIGIGTGFMDVGDVVCVPLGCSTPVILREGGKGDYGFVGDAYVDGYMNGEAIEQWKSGHLKLKHYDLH